MDDLLAEFIAETRETLETISGEIVAWEANPMDRERLDAVFRFVHTVKGSCGFLDLTHLQRVSHEAENALAGKYSKTVSLSCTTASGKHVRIHVSFPLRLLEPAFC